MITKEEKFMRFKDAEWFPVTSSIMLGGAGGINSWVAAYLTRMGVPHIVLIDHDHVEAVNLAGQFYSENSIGLSKVVALGQECDRFGGSGSTMFHYVTNKFDMSSEANKIMIGGFDNMLARKHFYERWKQNMLSDLPENRKNYLLIDGRLEAEQLQIFCVTENTCKAYEEKLFDDSEIPDASCTLKQTSHMAGMIGAYIAAFLSNFLSNQNLGANIRSVPFFYRYSVPNNYTEVIKVPERKTETV